MYSYGHMRHTPLVTVKHYVKSAFLQSGRTERYVYVTPPRECKEKRFVRLPDVETYGLVNENAKWQRHSDETLLDMELHALGHLPQVFSQKRKATIDGCSKSRMILLCLVLGIRGTFSKGSNLFSIWVLLFTYPGNSNYLEYPSLKMTMLV